MISESESEYRWPLLLFVDFKSLPTPNTRKVYGAAFVIIISWFASYWSGGSHRTVKSIKQLINFKLDRSSPLLPLSIRAPALESFRSQ
jgi:hypothetical protein